MKVNNNKVVPDNTVAPAQSTATVMPSNPIQSAPSNGVTPTVAPVQTPEPSFGPTMEPAYGTYEFDGFVIDGALFPLLKVSSLFSKVKSI